MFLKSVIGVALLVASVSGQNSTNSTSFAYIDPSSIDPQTRANWCRGQLNSCGFLCAPGGTPDQGNTCNDTVLTFVCTCNSNMSTPGLQFYTDTMPTYKCEENFQRCIAENVGVQASQDQCNSDEKANCGHLDPSKFVPPSASSSSSAGTTPTGTPVSSGASGASASTGANTSSSKGAAATMLAVGGEYGAGIVAAGVAAAFGLML